MLAVLWFEVTLILDATRSSYALPRSESKGALTIVRTLCCASTRVGEECSSAVMQ